MDHPDLLYKIKTSTPGSCERMVACLAWYISTLYGSYRQRCETSSEKKPFNPILGEVFKCNWEDSKSEWKKAELTVEQVCHHPPVSAFFAQIPKPNGQAFVTAQGHCGQKSSISTSTISVRQEGRAKVVVYDDDNSQETFIIHPLPDLTIAGLLTMQAFLELIGKTKITSSAGTLAEIEFVPCGMIISNQGWFSGQYFNIKGTVSNKDGETFCVLGGKWTEVSTFTVDGETKTLFDVKNQPQILPVVGDIQAMKENESLKLWAECRDAIKKKEYGVASSHKNAIEENQRKIRKQRKESGEPFVPNCFTFQRAPDDDKLGTTLQDPQQLIGGGENFQGHWIYKTL